VYKQGEKYLWKMPTGQMQDALQLASTYNMSVPLMQTLLTRGYNTPELIDSFLFSTFEKDVAHPALLKDAQKAVDRILHALDKGEKILIAGDYDVDGITSSALMMICLMPLGAQINFFLPHRVYDGYGLSVKTIQRAAENGYTLIVTVDNGITAFAAVDEAKKRGIDVIITDHHRPHEHLPDAYAIIDPLQVGCEYPYKKFAGVGVIFKIMTLLYEKRGLPLPAKAYELLLLGTVADVVPLTGENRFWVRQGLHHVNSAESYSLKVLKQNSKVTKPQLSATDIGFSITPQINALGRLEDPRQGVRFLIGSDSAEVDTVGRVLWELNQARKEIERSIFDEVVTQINLKHINLEDEYSIVAASYHWPPGVIGLVASRLVGAYGRPAILLHIGKDGIAKGSCRSIAQFNMFNALQTMNALLRSFGGHSVAAGLSLRADDIPQFKAQLELMLKEQLTPFDLKPKLVIDAELNLVDVTKKCIEDSMYLEPFGNENPPPLFYVKQVILVESPLLLKDLHVKCKIFADGVIKPVVFFNRPDLFTKLTAHAEQPCDMAVQLSENHWNDKVSIELIGLDVSFDA
jgi:single-stranded-DNA-specific exonuclease